MKKIIAKTHIGQEYIYSTRHCYAVSNAAAEAICQVINEIKWHLSDGETWKVYEAGGYEYTYTNAAFEKLTRYKGHITLREI